MHDYEKMYYLLFNAVTDAIELLLQNQRELAEVILREAQIKTEEIYISGIQSPQ